MRAVIVSVRYDDMLAVTLPAWKALLPAGTLAVATSPDDTASQAVAAQHGVPAIITDAWTRRDPTCHWGSRDATFNAAFGMDVCLGLAEDLRPRPEIGEVIININVDCYPQGKFCDVSALEENALYGVWRHHCLTPEMFGQVLRGKVTAGPFREGDPRVTPQRVPRMKNSGSRPVGYYQMWRYREGERFGSYPTAQKYDTHFCGKWKHLRYVEDFWLWHLGPQADAANWAGRVVPRWDAA